MTEENAGSESPDVPDVIVEKRRGFSTVWIIPIVAVCIGGYLGYDAYQNRGIQITIQLSTAEWLEEGKTKIKFRDVDVGTIDRIDVKADDKGVVATCTIRNSAKSHLVKGTEFWVVHPRVGAGGVSGLGTLLSGAYLAVRPGPPDAPPERHFTALEEPPVRDPNEPGLRLVLLAHELNSLESGTPVFFRETAVGQVDQSRIAKDGSSLEIQIFIRPEHQHLVRSDSRFWNVGGISISANLGQLDVKTTSVASLLTGGVAFDAPNGLTPAAAKPGSSFWLHNSKSDLDTYAYRYGGLRLTLETNSGGSIQVGDAVYYREVMIGAVVSETLSTDSRRVRLGINIRPRYASLVRSNSVFWNSSGINANLGLHGLSIHTESLQALLAGGIAMATPDEPGHLVKPDSVFRLHDEAKADWHKWSPILWRGAPDKAPKAAPKPKEHGIASFFHHEDKTESESSAQQDESDAGHPADEKKKHGFFHNLFHHD